MQHIATRKPEFAALPFNIKSASSLGAQQHVEFKSFLTLANPIYTQPVQPDPVHLDRHQAPNQVAVSASKRTPQTQTPEQRNQPEKQTVLSRDQSAQLGNDNEKDQATTKSVEPKSRRSTEDINGSEKNTQEDVVLTETKDSAMRTDSADNSPASKHDDNPSDSKSHAQVSTDEDENLSSKSTNGEQTDTSSEGGDPIDWVALVENSKGVNVDTDSTDVQMLPLGDIYLSQFIKASEGQNTESNAEQPLTEFDLSGEGEVVSDGQQILEPDSIVQTVDSKQGDASELFDNQEIQTLISQLAALLESRKEQPGQQSEADDGIAKILNDLLKMVHQNGESNSASDIENMLAELEIEGISTEALSDIQLLLAQQHIPSSQDTSSRDPVDNVEINATDENAKNINSAAAIVSAVNPKQADQTLTKDEPTAVGAEQEVKKVDHAIQTLLKQSPEKLDKSLDNLAQRLGIADTVLKTESGAEHVSGEGVKQDFVSAMKAGLEEIKAQLKQGHQPAIDLTTLVAEVATKTVSSQINPDTIGQTVNRFNQALEMAGTLNAKLDASALVGGLEKTVAKDNLAQSQIMQSKQAQQQMAQFDKAVNITRHEGQQQLAEKVRWMVNQNNLQADIRLDPPELGSMKVRVNMSGEAASVNIVVQSQQAREVLEQATPKLKELLEQQGIELGQSSVQQEQSGDEQQENNGFAGGSRQNSEQQGEESVVAEHRIHNGRIGGIDYFV